MSFNKSNWTRTTAPAHARVYSPSSIGGLPTQNITGNGGAAVLTITVPFQFQGDGAIECIFPPSSPGINTGAALGQPQLLAPASGAYSGGNHPRIQVSVTNSTNGNLTPQSNDLIFYQF